MKIVVASSAKHIASPFIWHYDVGYNGVIHISMFNFTRDPADVVIKM